MKTYADNDGVDKENLRVGTGTVDKEAYGLPARSPAEVVPMPP